ncbi:MAG: hypothetical protein ACLFQB_06840, partial [Chitinispirillaceae bacterium]
MKKRKSFSFAVLLIILAIPSVTDWSPSSSTSISFSAYAQNGHALSKDYVDSTILRAIYTVNEAATYAGVGYRHKEGITKAKRILNSLKRKAKGDPNESYIMWKIRELEGQIHLELEELRQIEAEKNQLTSNKLVLEYNAEVGKKRPDFAALRGIFMRMSEVDVNQANKLADSYNQRYKNISREAMYSLQKALMKGDVNLAQKELNYVEKNKFYLVISPRRLEKLKTKYDKLRSTLDEVPQIEKCLSKGYKAAKEFKLKKGRSNLSMAKSKLDRLKKNMPQKKWVSLSSRTDKHLQFLNNREDSLVKVNMRILQEKGSEAAGKYFQNVLQKMGLSQDRSSYIDQAILESKPMDTESNDKFVKDLQPDQDDNKSEVLSELRIAARKKAQKKTDSIRAIEEAKQAKRMNAAQKDSIKRAKARQNKLQLRKNQDRAAQLSVDIYDLLEKNRSKDAKVLFAKEKSFLSKYLLKDDFMMLELSLKHSPDKNIESKPEVKKAQ